MTPCTACGQETARRLCHFCQRTAQLIRRRLCVTCTAPVFDEDAENIQGRCAECRSRQVEVSFGTRRVLLLASHVRYMRRIRAAA